MSKPRHVFYAVALATSLVGCETRLDVTSQQGATLNGVTDENGGLVTQTVLDRLTIVTLEYLDAIVRIPRGALQPGVKLSLAFNKATGILKVDAVDADGQPVDAAAVPLSYTVGPTASVIDPATTVLKVVDSVTGAVTLLGGDYLLIAASGAGSLVTFVSSAVNAEFALVPSSALAPGEIAAVLNAKLSLQPGDAGASAQSTLSFLLHHPVDGYEYHYFKDAACTQEQTAATSSGADPKTIIFSDVADGSYAFTVQVKDPLTGQTTCSTSSLPYVVTGGGGSGGGGGGGGGSSVAKPVFSVAAATYNTAQSVTISSPTTGVQIFYTIDGSTPTAASTLYTGAIVVRANTTLKAIALKTGLDDSEVATVHYTVVDNAAPTGGSFVGSTAVSGTGFTLNWTAASDTVAAGETLLYRVCSGADATAIDTVAKCEGAHEEMPYTADATSLTVSGKAPGVTYYYNIVVKDLAGNTKLYEGAAQTTAATYIMVCPAGWTLVPAYSDGDINVPTFCVMKYEARNVSGVPTSKASGTPWVSIQRGATSNTANSAWRACTDLGADYDLISNQQWQAIARQIETAQSPAGVYTNWSNNAIGGSNAINAGHSDMNPWGVVAAGTDSDPCMATSNANCGNNAHADFSQKRTHTLPTGEVIWDFAGNAREWVKDDSTFNYGTSAYWYGFSSTTGNACATGSGCSGPQGKPKTAFGPVGSYASKSASPYGGLGYAAVGSTNGAIVRGGSFQTYGGIFSVGLDVAPTSTAGDVGFRCVVTPQTIVDPEIEYTYESCQNVTCPSPGTAAQAVGSGLTVNFSPYNIQVPVGIIPDSCSSNIPAGRCVMGTSGSGLAAVEGKYAFTTPAGTPAAPTDSTKAYCVYDYTPATLDSNCSILYPRGCDPDTGAGIFHMCPAGSKIMTFFWSMANATIVLCTDANGRLMPSSTPIPIPLAAGTFDRIYDHEGYGHECTSMVSGAYNLCRMKDTELRNGGACVDWTDMMNPVYDYQCALDYLNNRCGW